MYLGRPGLAMRLKGRRVALGKSPLFSKCMTYKMVVEVEFKILYLQMRIRMVWEVPASRISGMRPCAYPVARATVWQQILTNQIVHAGFIRRARHANL